MKKVLNWYRSILNNASLQADDEGYISAVLDDGEVPYLVDKKRLVLPTRENMAKDKEANAILVFHPLSENILENESPAMSRYRHSVNTVVNWRLAKILDDLFQIAGSPGESANAARPLTPDQLSILRHVGEVDAKMYQNWQALNKAMPLGDSQKCITHIYIKKQAQINGKSYRRGAIISFPLYDALMAAGKDRKVFGVQLRKSDIECLINTLKIVLPNLEEPGHYNRGSTSDTTPTIHALLQGLLGLAANVNAIVELFSSVRPEMKTSLYDTEWVELLNNPHQFDSELAMIPHQAGNSGTVEKPSNNAAAAFGAHAPSNTATGMSAALPEQAATKPGANPNIVYNVDGTIDAQATNAKMAQQQQAGYAGYQPQGYGQQQQVPPGFGFGNMGYAQPPMNGPMAARSASVPAYELSGYGVPAPVYQPPGYGGYQPPGYGQSTNYPQQGYGQQGYQAPYGNPRV